VESPHGLAGSDNTTAESRVRRWHSSCRSATGGCEEAKRRLEEGPQPTQGKNRSAAAQEQDGSARPNDRRGWSGVFIWHTRSIQPRNQESGSRCSHDWRQQNVSSHILAAVQQRHQTEPDKTPEQKQCEGQGKRAQGLARPPIEGATRRMWHGFQDCSQFNPQSCGRMRRRV
jgi:hypothetical protein